MRWYLKLTTISILLCLSCIAVVDSVVNWSTPINVSNDPGTSGSTVLDMAIDSSGRLHAVWSDHTPGSNEEIFYSRNDGSGWSPPVNISNTSTASRGGGMGPSMVIDGTGKLHVIWLENVATFTGDIYYTTNSGTGWSAPSSILTMNNMGSGMSMAVDSSGKMHVVWLQRNEEVVGEIRFKLYYAWKDGAKLTTPVEIDDNSWPYANIPFILADSSGRLHLFRNNWPAGTPESNSEIYYNRNDGAGWGNRINISNSPGIGSWNPLAASDSSGRLHVAWSESGSTYYRQYDVNNNSWSTSERAVNGWLNNGSMTVDAFGNSHIVTYASAGNGFNNMLYTRNYGTGWSTPEKISQGRGWDSGPMLFDSSGNLHVLWRENLVSSHDLFYRKGTLIPTVNSVSPASLSQGATNQNVTISGSDFKLGTTVSFSGTGITVNLVTVNSPIQITANISISSNAALGSRDVTVANSDGSGTKTGAFTVTQTVSSNNSSITASPTSVIADGSSITTITITIKDPNNSPIVGKNVTLTASGTGNTLTQPSSPTNVSGQTTASLKSTKAETKTITATVDSVSFSTQVSFIAGPVSASNSVVGADPASLVANGTAASTITVTLRDANNNPVLNKQIALEFSGTNNTIGSTSLTTDANGNATTTIKSTKAEAKNITVKDASGNALLTVNSAVTFVPGPVSASVSTVTVSPASAVADNQATATITVILLDANSNSVTNKTVSAAASGTGNTIAPASALTNSNGQATFTIKSTKAETKTITATNSTDNIQLTSQPTVSFTPGAVSASESTVSVSPTSVLADNTATATVTVTLFDANNNLVSGKSLSLSLSGSNNTISPTSAITNASGQATFTIKSSTPEVKTVTVNVEGNISLNQTPKITFTATIADGTGSATISPTSLPVNSPGVEIRIVYTPAGSITNGAISVDIPSGWTPPQGNQGTAGYTTATSTGTIGALSFAGQTITVSITSLASNQTITVVYGSGDGASGATAPSNAGSHTFTVKSKVANTPDNSLISLLAGSPSLNLTRAADGSGSATVSPTSMLTGTTGALAFTFTAAGQMDGGEISITAPSGWSGIQSTNANSNSPNAAIGPASVLGQTVSVPITKLAEAQTLSLSFTVTAPSAAGTTTFVVKSRGGPSGALTAIASSPSVTVTLPVAPDGSGSATVSPTSLTSGAITTLTITYTAVGNMNGGAISVTIPTSWPQPQSGNVSATSTGTIGVATFSGWVVTIPITTLAGGQTVTVTYSNVIAPSAGTYEFTVKSKGAVGGTLTNIASQPSVNVTAPVFVITTPVTFAAGDGTGKVSVIPDSLFVKSKENKIIFTFTSEGTMNNGAISLTIPSGWSPPQTNPSKAGYVGVSSTGSLGSLTIAAQTITVPITALSANQTIRIEYGGIWEGSGVTAPSTAGTYAFTFKSQASASGGLKEITKQPIITVIDLPHVEDGSGEVKIIATSPEKLVATSSGNEIRFRFTALGLMNLGAISFSTPQSWSPPQGISGQPGYTVASPASEGASIDVPIFSGATVTVPIISLDKDQSLDIIYGSGGGASGAITSDLVNAPINFVVKSMADSANKGRQLKPLLSQPTVTLSYVTDGSGILTIEPNTVIAGNSGYQITFTYTASGLMKDGMFTMTLPDGWTPPQLTGGIPGQISISATGSVSQPIISGQNITIPISRLAGGQFIKIVYGIGGSVKAPDNIGINSFQAKSQSTASGSLTLLQNQATLLVSNAIDGTGKVKIINQPVKVTAGSKNNQISFIYTPIGTIVDGELSLEVPVLQGWSQPQLQSNLPGAVSVSSTGSVGIISILGNVIRVPIKSLKSDQSLTIQYGSVGASGAWAPIVSTNSKFEVKVKGSATGVLSHLTESDQPIIKVENAADDSGEVSFSTNPANIYSGQSGLELTFVYKAVGTMDGGAISLSFPAGWSPPQGELGKAGYTVVTSTGQIGALEFITSASTLKVPIIKVGASDTITIIYGSGGKESGGKAPSVIGTAPLTLKSQGSVSGTLQPVSGQLSVTLKLNSPPIITQIGSQAIVPNQPIIFEANEGSELSFNLSAKDAENDPISYKAENLPKGSSFDSTTGKFSWKLGYDLVSVSEGAKDFIVKVSATDGQLTDTKEVTIRVNQVSRAADLTIELSPDKLVADGKTTSKVIVKVLDSEGKVVADEVVSLKANLGKITSSATNNNDGTYTAEYTSATTTGNAIITATTSNNKSKSATIALTH